MDKMVFVVRSKGPFADGTAFLVLNKEKPTQCKGTFLILRNGEKSQVNEYSYNNWKEQITSGHFKEIPFEEALQHVEIARVGIAAANVIKNISHCTLTARIADHDVIFTPEGIQFGCTSLTKQEVESTIALWNKFQANIS